MKALNKFDRYTLGLQLQYATIHQSARPENRTMLAQRIFVSNTVVLITVLLSYLDDNAIPESPMRRTSLTEPFENVAYQSYH